MKNSESSYKVFVVTALLVIPLGLMMTFPPVAIVFATVWAFLSVFVGVIFELQDPAWMVASLVILLAQYLLMVSLCVIIGISRSSKYR